MSTPAEQLKDKLFYTKKNSSLRMTEEELAKAFAFCEDYKHFLDISKTEREAVDASIDILEKNGFTPLVIGKKYVPGDRVYYNNRGKAMVCATIGRRPLSDGLRIAAAHVDSPRLDLKPNPIYEDSELAYFKTQYYGGIKKYQWTTIALAAHGVIVKKDGTTVKICIGEDANDPVFCIPDLLPHLGENQNKRPLSEGIKGEELNILLGSTCYRDESISESVKLNILNILFEKYGITEEDFLSAELTFVPAEKARDIGLDRSMIGSYGHDDRVCAYTELMAALDAKSPEYTAVTIFADREETGSDGNTGMNSNFLQNFISALCMADNTPLWLVLSNSKCYSADVNAAFDPTFPDVSEFRNAARLGYGTVVTKYTGGGGKGGTSEASAEFMSFTRQLLDSNNVIWQTGELGKVDVGGGGTVAKFLAKLDIDVVDVGVPVLSMHAPMEIVSKADVYNTYLAFKHFYGAEDTVQTAKEKPFRYLALGNSITLHGKCDYWWNLIGMSASVEENDYYHLITKGLTEKYGSVESKAHNYYLWEIQAHDRAETFDTLTPYLSADLDLITIQLSENVRDLTTFHADYLELIAYLKKSCPNAKIILIDDFWSDEKAALKKAVADELTIPFADLSAARGNTLYHCGMGTTVYGDDGAPHTVDHQGVANHPGDKGMRFIADAVLALL